ncbi:DUF4221 family protein [uncultured Marivirga sp.]|uniref:DUF4221 family protein n=1 Tax=uncultured Marivirga sp. TaxID=1123707 RepID=UPI0030ED7A9B
MKFKGLYLIFFIICSCSKLKEVENNTLDFSVLKSIEIPINADVQYEHSQIQLVGEDEFVGLDRNFSKLDFFSLKENKFLFSTQLESEGPNRIYPVSSFCYHNMDSIFLFSLDASSFQLINQEGEVMNSFRMVDNQYPSKLFNDITGSDSQFFPFSITQNGNFYIPFSYNNQSKELIINTVPNSYLDGFNDRKTFYSAPLISKFDFETLEFSQFSGRWPEIYDQKNAPNNPFNTFCLNTDTEDLLINFYNSSEVFSVKEDEFFNVESNSAKGDVTLFDIENKKGYSTEEELDAFNNDEGYVNLIYDKYQNVYYRIFKSSTHNSEENVHKMKANWFLIAFTPEFEVLGEVEFPASIYNFLHILPTQDGLLISKESAWSTENNEEKYEFDLVKINF